MSEDGARLSSVAVLGGPLHREGLPSLPRAGGDHHRLRPFLPIPAGEPRPSPLFMPGSWRTRRGPRSSTPRARRASIVNFEKVEGRAVLHEGDMLRLGPPQDRSSMMLQLEFGGELLEARANPDAPPVVGRDEDTGRGTDRRTPLLRGGVRDRREPTRGAGRPLPRLRLRNSPWSPPPCPRRCRRKCWWPTTSSWPPSRRLWPSPRHLRHRRLRPRAAAFGRGLAVRVRDERGRLCPAQLRPKLGRETDATRAAGRPRRVLRQRGNAARAGSCTGCGRVLRRRRSGRSRLCGTRAKAPGPGAGGRGIRAGHRRPAAVLRGGVTFAPRISGCAHDSACGCGRARAERGPDSGHCPDDCREAARGSRSRRVSRWSRTPGGAPSRASPRARRRGSARAGPSARRGRPAASLRRFASGALCRDGWGRARAHRLAGLRGHALPRRGR